MASPQPQPPPTTVVVADNHELFRTGLCVLLAREGVRVVAEATTAQEAIEATTELAPQVLILDVSMAETRDTTVTRRLVEEAPESRVLVLTASAREDDLIEAIVAGAAGYVAKDAPFEQILMGVRAVADGESFLSSRVAARLLARIRSGGSLAGSDELQPQLSERELAVLRLMAAGCENQEIATKLFISPQTVKNHVSSILSKLRMANRIQAAVYAVRHGIV